MNKHGKIFIISFSFFYRENPAKGELFLLRLRRQQRWVSPRVEILRIANWPTDTKGHLLFYQPRYPQPNRYFQKLRWKEGKNSKKKEKGGGVTSFKYKWEGQSPNRDSWGKERAIQAARYI